MILNKEAETELIVLISKIDLESHPAHGGGVG